MDKKAFFFIDDVIWLFRDLTRQRPASLFDNPFMKMLKEKHERYGMMVQLNIFYRTDYFYGSDEFTLDEMTDAYKAEWEACSDWLKLGLHAKQEFPDYPYVNASYETVQKDIELIRGNIIRFAGEKSVSRALITHWFAISKEGVRAFRDAGYRFIATSRGDLATYVPGSDMLPYAHVIRLEQNQKKETTLYSRSNPDESLDYGVCGYNHLTSEVSDPMEGTTQSYYDSEMDVYFKFLEYGFVVNDSCYGDLDKLNEDYGTLLGKELIIFPYHEQYFYSDYVHYEPNYVERIERCCQIMEANGYRWIQLEDIIPEA